MRAPRRIDGEPELGEVVDVTLEGLGVLARSAKRVMVPGVLPGERVRYRRRLRHRNYDEGELLEVIEASPQRADPACRYFGTCGGCSLQHFTPGGQLAIKQRALLESLRRIGQVEPAEVLPALAGSAWGYRRRARLAARYVEKKGRVLVGFRERDNARVADMLGCETIDPGISSLIPALSALAGGLSIRARLPQFEVTVADNATAVVVRTLAGISAADREQLLAFSETHCVRLYLQTAGPESVMALDPEGMTEDLSYTIPGFELTLRFGPVDFIQVHREMNLQMIDRAVALLAPAADDRVIDLFCGIGNFSLPLATRAAHVTGIEGIAAASNRAAGNAGLNGLTNTRFVTGDLAGAALEGAWTRERYDLALLDPPRSGAAELMPLLPQVGARRIIYVSCHPGTLARDAGLLVHTHGYRLAAAGVMDMFPQTSHVESIALFSRE